MIKPQPSLLERAAEVYDFASGLKVAPPPADLPPPRVRRAEVAKVVQPAVSDLPSPIRSPEPARSADRAFPGEGRGPAQDSSAAGLRPSPGNSFREPRPSAMRKVAHDQVAIDIEYLARAGFVMPDAPVSGLAEETRLVKRRLLAAIDAAAQRCDPRARTVLIASGQPGEGKTFVAINLALSIAGEQDRSVLLIDGDTAKSDLPARFGIEDRPGFVDALADRSIDPEALVVDTDLSGLSILTAGRKERNVPELLASARTGEVLERLLSADPNRIILIDSPPALAASPAGVLASQVGQCLVVVRADTTSEADLKETIDLLSTCPSLSLVLNSTAFTVGGRRFGRYEEYR